LNLDGKMTRQKTFAFVPALAALLVSVCGATGCKSGPTPTIDPFEQVESDRGADILDRHSSPTTRARAVRARSDDGVEYMMPTAGEELGKTIDGTPSDWDLSRARSFAHERFVEVGAEVWKGPSDASFRVAIDADDSYVYFFIEVTDDVALNQPPQSPADAVIIWLRDPQLDRLGRILPETLRTNQLIKTETAIIFSPDGRFARYGSDDPIVSQSVFAAGTRTPTGYALEIAFGMSALPQVAEMPMQEIAFRVEVLDGDNPSRPGVEKHLSMLPQTDEDTARYALFDLPGWLPHHAIKNPPPRVDALGAWVIGPDGWDFRNIEFVVPNWRVLDHLEPVRATLTDRQGLPELCRALRNEVRLLEAYQATSGNHRVILAMCGTPPDGNRCPQAARSQLMWIHMTPEGRGNPDELNWQVQSTIEVFEEPLNQCTSQPVEGAAYFHGFSTNPLPMVNPSVWAVGWNSRQQTPLYRLEESGVIFVDPQSSSKRVGAVRTHQRSSAKDERTLRNSRVFLTALDQTDGLDLCEVEHIEEQSCEDVDRGCVTRERRRETLTHIRTWNPSKRIFEPYLLTRHPQCTGRTTYGDVDGFKLLHVNDRIGLLPGGRARN
jgi:hypothetical protein